MNIHETLRYFPPLVRRTKVLPYKLAADSTMVGGMCDMGRLIEGNVGATRRRGKSILTSH
jgi:hypothetical protein